MVCGGEDGAAYAETGIYDLLILDVMMPKLNRSLLRRQGDQIDILRYSNTILDLSGCSLRTESASIRLSKKKFDVMRLLMQFQGRSIRKDVLLTRVWGYDSNAVENNVEAYVGFLRKKLRALALT